MIPILKTSTQKKAGFKIDNYNSSRRLSEIICIETGISLSYNTLRRFFGIVKTVKPSNHTLDTLALFNGFLNYTDFTRNFDLKNRWEQEFKLASLMQDSEKELLLFIEENLHTKRDFTLKLTQIVRELMLVKNYDLLVQIFSLKKMTFDHFNFDDIAYFGNCAGKLLKTFDSESEELQKLLLNDNFLDLILTIYVDYKHLNSYYGNWLKIIEKHTKRKDVKQFCRGVLNLKMYLNKESPNHFFKLVQDSSFHPILKGRIISQELFYETKDLSKIMKNYQHQIPSSSDSETDIDYYFELMTTAIITRNFEVMTWISEKFKIKTNYSNYYKFEHYELYGLMVMLLFMFRQDFKSLQLWQKSVSFDNFPRNYETLMLQYVYILKYHNSKTNKISNKNQYLESSKNFYPSFFNEAYLNDYFKS
jgi:hypothetical protein